MAAYPKFMKGKADILGNEGLGLLMGWHNLFFPQEIYMNTASNRRDNQDSPRNLTERPMYAHTLNNGWNGLGKPIERKENPTLSVDFPCAEYGKVFFYARESGAVIIPRGFSTYHTFTRSLDVSTEGQIIAFLWQIAGLYYPLPTQTSTMRLGQTLTLHHYHRVLCILRLPNLASPKYHSVYSKLSLA